MLSSTDEVIVRTSNGQSMVQPTYPVVHRVAQSILPNPSQSFNLAECQLGKRLRNQSGSPTLPAVLRTSKPIYLSGHAVNGARSPTVFSRPSISPDVALYVRGESLRKYFFIF